MRIIDKDEIRRRLTYPRCIPIVREAMIAFSAGKTQQLLRSILPLGEGRMFGVMPGALGGTDPFGAKLLGVYPDAGKAGRSSHQGVVVLFDAETGAPVCVADASEVTAIRTAAASAVATEALSRTDARTLTILGYGEQASTHARAMMQVRPFSAIKVWGRAPERAQAFAATMAGELGVDVQAVTSVETAVAGAHVICTLTAAPEPILLGRWVKPGTHVNVVGSSSAGPVEIDDDLVTKSRFIADSREGVLAQGAEFLRAKAAGLIDDTHVVAEIGEVLAGVKAGRRSETEITVYKSLGHVAQDLAAVTALWRDGEHEVP
jgi:ornithine cyclodeaminase